MKHLLAALPLVALLLASAPEQGVAMNHAQAAAARYTNSMCHQKIDPKNLTGQKRADAWKACRESPDTYN